MGFRAWVEWNYERNESMEKGIEKKQITNAAEQATMRNTEDMFRKQERMIATINPDTGMLEQKPLPWLQPWQISWVPGLKWIYLDQQDKADRQYAARFDKQDLQSSKGNINKIVFE